MKRYRSDSYFPIYRTQHQSTMGVIAFWNRWLGRHYV